MKRLVITHLSDITKHHAQLVHYMTVDCINEISRLYPDIRWRKFYLWSDGCASQYKGKHSFYYLDKYNVSVERHFFGSEHGKGECDSETGLISQTYSTAVKSDKHLIINASDMKDLLCTKNNDEKSRIFKVVKDDDAELKAIMESFEDVHVKTLSGTCTRTLHQIKTSEKPGVLLTRRFSCFCPYCKEISVNSVLTKK